jgi:hypothetical protein
VSLDKFSAVWLTDQTLYGSTDIGWLQPGSVIQTQGTRPTTQVSPSELPSSGNKARLPLSRPRTSSL